MKIIIILTALIIIASIPSPYQIVACMVFAAAGIAAIGMKG